MTTNTSDTHPRSDDALVASLTEGLADADLEVLQPGQPGWAPRDEYEPEAESLAAVFRERGTIDVADLRAVWLHWFSDDLSGYTPDELEAVVAEFRSRVAAP
jgi:hypothetical protein